jgi:hypothetical protein
VDVKDAGNRAVWLRGDGEPLRWQRDGDQNSNGGREGRRHEQQLFHQSYASGF